ncbi:MAG: hypothetical protein RDU89_05410 [bacterium]|nr:hypothetical protein [bacterium]
MAVNSGNVLAFESPPGACVGNLVENPGFEDGLASWAITNGGLVGGIEPHEGSWAAGLGTCGRNRQVSTLEQDIRIPEGECGRFFALTFQLAGRWKFPASLQVSLTWLDSQRQPLGTGAWLYIPRRAVGNGSQGSWNTYSLITTEAPARACWAQLRFVKSGGYRRRNFAVIDDVILVGALPTCFPGGSC